jgi:hypothetical protein
MSPLSRHLRLVLLTTCVWGAGGGAWAAEAAPVAVKCPPTVPNTATCFGGVDSAGAHYAIAQPKDWNGTLVLHAHGGPFLGAPTAERAMEDLVRWAIFVKAGYAYAGSSFRQGGVAATAAAEDTERLRGLYRAHVAQPTRTLLHGQSWGASVAVKAAERFTAATLGTQPYDAVLLSAGVLGGGTHSYDFRADLRAVYQHLCHNHPRPSEPQYPLGLGLPAGVSMTAADLEQRVTECLGSDKKDAPRIAEQRAKAETLAKVIKIPESHIRANLRWATFLFQDISRPRTGGGNPFGNVGVRYTGSGDDAALNAAVPRFSADPEAYRRLAADMDPTGRIPVPVLTVKWIGDTTAFVELDGHFKSVMAAGGSGDRLVQTFTTQAVSHSYISDPTYPALAAAVLKWATGGPKPTPQSVADDCRAFEAQFGPGCSFAPAYVPAALSSRVPERQRP